MKEDHVDLFSIFLDFTTFKRFFDTILPNANVVVLRGTYEIY